ncbi:hypothetical protein NE865_12681 [Phthorimaea operculella]|nr:hypothetical protein NE865_12681 [Phthorimaea operculella]
MSNLDAEVLKSMAATREFVANKIAEFQAELKQAGRKQPNSIAALNGEFVAFKAMVCNALDVLQTQVDLIARGQDRIEMHSRRKMLLVHGVPEEKNENTTSRLTTLLSSKISAADIAPGSIRTSHRMGTTKSDSKGKPRPILVKFADTSARDRIWFGKKALKDSGVTLSEFLTKPRHDAFMAARNKFGIKNCWTQNGFIHVKTPNGEKHKIESMTELDRLIAGPQSTGTTP